MAETFEEFMWEQKHGPDPPGRWKALSQAERQRLAPLDRALGEYAGDQQQKQPIWCCRHCESHDKPADVMSAHLKEK